MTLLSIPHVSIVYSCMQSFWCMPRFYGMAAAMSWVGIRTKRNYHGCQLPVQSLAQIDR